MQTVFIFKGSNTINYHNHHQGGNIVETPES
jgi:hypothetical protein